MNTATNNVKKPKEQAAPLRNIMILEDLLISARDRELHLPGIVTFSGPSGFGKSTAAAYVAAKHQAYYIEMRSTWTVKAFLEVLLRRMGMEPRRTAYQMMDQVAGELAVSRRTLIIDEFDHAVTRDLVERVRDLYEMSQAPIVVIGEELLPQKLQKWERFHGRVMDWAQAEPANLDDARALNKHYTPDITLDPEMLGYLVAEARGSVRRIVTNLDRIARFARSEQLKTVSRDSWGDRKLHSAMPPEPRSAKQLGGK